MQAQHDDRLIVPVLSGAVQLNRQRYRHRGEGKLEVTLTAAGASRRDVDGAPVLECEPIAAANAQETQILSVLSTHLELELLGSNREGQPTRVWARAPRSRRVRNGVHQ